MIVTWEFGHPLQRFERYATKWTVALIGKGGMGEAG